MKILFLITETINHCYFIDKIKKLNKNIFIVLENNKKTSFYYIEKKIKHSSYIEGLNNFFSNEVIKLLKKKGIISYPTAIAGISNKKTDLFKLNRLTCI